MKIFSKKRGNLKFTGYKYLSLVQQDLFKALFYCVTKATGTETD